MNILNNYYQQLSELSKNFQKENIDSFWIELIDSLELHRFVAEDIREQRKNQNSNEKKVINYQPVLLLHGNKLDHCNWSQLAIYLWDLGFRHIFSSNLFSSDSKDLNELYDIIHLMLNILINFVSKIDCIYILHQSLGKEEKEILTQAVNKTHKSLQPDIRSINFSSKVDTSKLNLELLVHYITDKLH